MVQNHDDPKWQPTNQQPNPQKDQDDDAAQDSYGSGFSEDIDQSKGGQATYTPMNADTEAEMMDETTEEMDEDMGPMAPATDETMDLDE